MMRLVSSTDELPVGTHAVSFYGSRPEAARRMASYLKGGREHGQEALILSNDDEMIGLYRREIDRVAPGMSEALVRISGPHATETPDGLRPVPAVNEFIAAHPEGATMCGDTIPGLLTRGNLSDVLTYEEWFDSLRPYVHRGLCPYDLARIPVDRAPEALQRLAGTHSHGVLSDDPNPGVRFVQLFVVPYVENPPEEHLGWLARAVDYGLIDQDAKDDSLSLTPRGETFARALLRFPVLPENAADSVPDRTGPDASRA
jgi:MEDS: MEthanogen/methylotroph, DcmR Sensory domain